MLDVITNGSWTVGLEAFDRLCFGLGIFTGQTLPGQPVSDEYRAIVTLAREADALGFESLWLSEHHFAEDAYLPSMLPMMGAVLGATERIKVGTAIMIPSFEHPIRLAEDIAVLDQFSRGRVLLGLGLGWRSHEFMVFSQRKRDQAAKIQEIVAILRRLWANDPTPFEGRFYQLPDMLARPLPFTPGGPPILLAGSKEKPIRRAARIADGLFYSRSGPTAASVQPKFDTLNSALDWVDEERGATADTPFSLTLLCNVFVSETDPWRDIGPGVDHQFAIYARWKAQDAGLPPPGVTGEQAAIAAGRNLMCAGTPEQVTAELGEWVETIAPRRPMRLMVKMHYPGVDTRVTLGSMELFAQKVMPALRERVSQPP